MKLFSTKNARQFFKKAAAFAGALLCAAQGFGATAAEKQGVWLLSFINANPVGAFMTATAALLMVIAAMAVLLWLGQKTSRALYSNQRQLRLALEHTSIMVWRYDKRKRRIEATVGTRDGLDVWRAVENVPESLIKSGMVFPESAQAMLDMYDRLNSGEKTVEGIFKMRPPSAPANDAEFYEWQHIVYTNIYDKHGRATEAIAVCEDVTAAHNARLEYEKLAQYDETMTADSLVRFEIDLTEDKITKRLVFMPEVYSVPETESWSAQAKQICSAITGKQRTQTADILSCKNLISEYTKGRRELSQEVYVRLASDMDYVWVTIFAYMICTQANQHILCKIYIKDTDAQKKRAEELIKRARNDPMTGLLNKKAGQDSIEKHLRERSPKDKPSILIMIDIDDFKKVNDAYGHIAGDSVIKGVAEAIKATFRESDILARFGGDEFIVLMKNTQRDIAESRIAELFEQFRHIDASDGVSVSCSVGAASTVGKIDYGTLLHRADGAMYAAKGAGKGCWRFYESARQSGKNKLCREK